MFQIGELRAQAEGDRRNRQFGLTLRRAGAAVVCRPAPEQDRKTEQACRDQESLHGGGFYPRERQAASRLPDSLRLTPARIKDSRDVDQYNLIPGELFRRDLPYEAGSTEGR